MVERYECVLMENFGQFGRGRVIIYATDDTEALLIRSETASDVCILHTQKNQKPSRGVKQRAVFASCRSF